jgi:hypothetical protein
MIVSSLADDGAEQTVAALALGATDAMPKPGTGKFNGRFAEVLLHKLKAIGFADEHQPLAEPLRLQGYAPLRAMPADPIGLLAIGASTGGIHAISACSSRFRPGSGYRSWSPSICRFRSCRCSPASWESPPGAKALWSPRTEWSCSADRILIAPGDAHLTIEPVSGGHVARLVARGCSERLPALARPDVRVSGRRIRRPPQSESFSPEWAATGSKARGGWLPAEARSSPRTKRAARSGECLGRSSRRASPARSCRRTRSPGGSLREVEMLKCR